VIVENNDKQISGFFL